MRYVDGFIVPVPKKNLQAYRRMAKTVGKVWRSHGALEFREYVADDVKVGKWTSFPRSVRLKRGETVIFAWIVNSGNASTCTRTSLPTAIRPRSISSAFASMTNEVRSGISARFIPE